MSGGIQFSAADGLGNVIPVSAANPLPVTSSAGGAVGPGTAATAQRVTYSSDGAPVPTYDQQGVIASGPITLVANTAQTIIAAFADRRGMRVLNWTASPVYLTNGVTGTPPSGGGSDYIPAAVGGVPGQWEPPYAPVNGVRAVGASAGDLTVTVW